MGSVKFNRGLKGAELNNPEDALAFLAKTSTLQTAKDYGYLYLGTNLVATKYLREMDLTGLSSGLLEIGTGLGGDSILAARGIITATSATYDWSNTSYVPTAQVIADYVSKTTAASDSYHGTGTWGTSTSWKVYTSKFYVGGSEVTSGQTGYVPLAFTLPVASSFSASDDTHLTTPKQIADYFAGLSGGMRYIGALSSNAIPANSKCGDVFIASAAFTVGTSPQRKIESGDMIVLNSDYSSGNLAYNSTSGKWNFDQFERNLDGAIYKGTGTWTQYGVAYVSSSGDTINSTSAGDSGQVLISNGNGAPDWVEYYYEVVTDGTTGDDSFTVTPFTNHSPGTVKTITIDNVNHAKNAGKILEKTQANASRNLLVGYASRDDTTEYKDLEYNSVASITQSGELTTLDTFITEKTGSFYGSGTIDVSYALTWQTLPNPTPG